MSSDSRLVIVSNRPPVTARVVENGIQLAPSAGGLGTGLQPYHEGGGGLWVGWPGDVSRVTPDERAGLESQLPERAMVPVRLSRDHVERYSHGFADRVPWSLFFHYSLDRIPVEAAGWDAYREVHEVFADAVAYEHRAGDTIWVHDYQLMLLPSLLRETTAGRAHRVLSSHPIPILGGLSGVDMAPGDPHRLARRRPRRLPHTRLHAAFPCVAAARRGRRTRHRQGPTRRTRCESRRIPHRD